MKGKLIVIYGINNLGKTRQAHLLVKKLKQVGLKAEYTKYALYHLKPSGPFINKILRSAKQSITEEEFQMWYALNRFQYEPVLLKKLNKGIIIVAEDYIGTSLTWGAVKGADLKWLKAINQPLYKEDLAILLDGQPFLRSRERKHLHESNKKLTQLCRKKHLELAKKYHWHIISANQSIEKVHSDIWNIVKSKLESWEFKVASHQTKMSS